MNEMDLKTKIEGLEKAIKEHKDFTGTYESQLKETQQKLDDYNKPELTPIMMDEIHNTIENVVNDFNFEDEDLYDKEFELDYDGRVKLSHISINCTYELVEKIVERVCNLFKEVENEETKKE